jgi:hypothetical protein
MEPYLLPPSALPSYFITSYDHAILFHCVIGSLLLPIIDLKGKKRIQMCWEEEHISVPFLEVLEIASTMIGSYFLPNSISHRFRFSSYMYHNITSPNGKQIAAE